MRLSTKEKPGAEIKSSFPLSASCLTFPESQSKNCLDGKFSDYDRFCHAFSLSSLFQFNAPLTYYLSNLLLSQKGLHQNCQKKSLQLGDLVVCCANLGGLRSTGAGGRRGNDRRATSRWQLPAERSSTLVSRTLTVVAPCISMCSHNQR